MSHDEGSVAHTAAHAAPACAAHRRRLRRRPARPECSRRSRARSRSGPPPRPPPAPRRTAPLKPSAYRLQPLTGYGPPRAAPARTLVRREPFLRISGRGRTMVLTFDDGPDPRYTPDILDTLAEYDVRAMFFVCGEMAVDNQDLLARMADEGHVVGNHTWSHPLLTRLTRGRDPLRDGTHLRRHRGRLRRAAPSGSARPTAPGTAPPSNSAPNSAWSPSPGPSTPSTGPPPAPAPSSARVENGAAPGVVVLSHDAGGDRSQSVRALRDYLPRTARLRLPHHRPATAVHLTGPHRPPGRGTLSEPRPGGRRRRRSRRSRSAWRNRLRR